MAETSEAEEQGKGASPEQVPEGQPRGRRKIILLVLALVLLIGVGITVYVLAFRHADDSGTQIVDEAPETFVEVEPMQVNLRTTDGSAPMLKVHFVLVPGKLDPEAITKRLPLVIDSYQPFLRELRPEDIAGSAATFRLKEEMLVRANSVLGRGAVKDVLIQDLVQQ